MKIVFTNDADELGILASGAIATAIKKAISEKDSANIIVATGASQFSTLHHLVLEKGIDWSKVVLFHLDEYVGMPDTHPASFRKYINDRFLAKLPSLKSVHFIQAESNIEMECNRIGQILSSHPIDVAITGIGENGHIAFNDPPADFDTEEPYIIVNLDESCRHQQFGEGWFDTMDSVPIQAISMSVKQIMKSKEIICAVPELRKALAVKNTLEKDIGNLYPASILRSHPNCTLFLDKHSASMLSDHLAY